VMLLGSESLISEIVQRIRAGNWAPAALRETVKQHARFFDDLEDTYLRARAEDIRDIGRHLLMRIQSKVTKKRKYPKNCILMGNEISISQITAVPARQLAGIVCAKGSGASHIAIIANGLGIPAVMGLGDLPVGQLDDCRIVVDGYNGQVCVDPSSLVKRQFKRLVKEEKKISASLQELRDLPGETKDGLKIGIYVNSGLLADVSAALNSGAEGVGLYRTEFQFLVRQSFPGEDEQYHNYRKVLESFAPRHVVMRTLDVGGDKALPYFPMEEDNPFLGWRGIRFTLDHSEIFLTQLRAMLRASAGLHNLYILLPMVSRMDEV
ncbi:MAG: phosphoenolpyruvate-protein phosphotransferase PtsP, partial [Gammaproteobacteria bacterium]|nr:phosphoenolpyruvate-protein phosphotransferase PtsP [Gammaproteobacteria bacterium]